MTDTVLPGTKCIMFAYLRLERIICIVIVVNRNCATIVIDVLTQCMRDYVTF